MQFRIECPVNTVYLLYFDATPITLFHGLKASRKNKKLPTLAITVFPNLHFVQESMIAQFIEVQSYEANTAKLRTENDCVLML